MTEPTEPHFEMTGARRNELLRTAKSKAEKTAIHLAYEERQCRLRLGKANVLLEQMNSVNATSSIEHCSIDSLTCKLLSYRKGTQKVHMRVRTGMAVLGQNRKTTVRNRDDL